MNGLKGIQTDHISAAEADLARIERGLSTAITALEILTGICAGLEDVALPEIVPDDIEGERRRPLAWFGKAYMSARR